MHTDQEASQFILRFYSNVGIRFTKSNVKNNHEKKSLSK